MACQHVLQAIYGMKERQDPPSERATDLVWRNASPNAYSSWQYWIMYGVARALRCATAGFVAGCQLGSLTGWRLAWLLSCPCQLLA